MAVDRRARGHAVEVAARDLLQRAGLTELATNANYRGGELDLVMQDATRSGTPTVVFVEVRYRQSEQFGGAVASFTRQKQARIIAATQHYVIINQLSQCTMRFDVVAIAGGNRINWIKNAFQT